MRLAAKRGGSRRLSSRKSSPEFGDPAAEQLKLPLEIGDQLCLRRVGLVRRVEVGDASMQPLEARPHLGDKGASGIGWQVPTLALQQEITCGLLEMADPPRTADMSCLSTHPVYALRRRLSLVSDT